MKFYVHSLSNFQLTVGPLTIYSDPLVNQPSGFFGTPWRIWVSFLGITIYLDTR